MNRFRVDYTVHYERGAEKDYFIEIEVESFYRAVEKCKTILSRCQVRDSKTIIRKFELIKEVTR